MKMNGNYLTIEEYRQKIGFTSVQPLYRAIREGRLDVIRIGIGRRILIPANAVLTDRRIKDGRYIGLRRWIARQISNAEDLEDFDQKKQGISTKRNSDVDNE